VTSRLGKGKQQNIFLRCRDACHYGANPDPDPDPKIRTSAKWIRIQLLSSVTLKGQCHEIFDFWFFHESVSPKPPSILLGPFRIFLKICGDTVFAAQGAPPGGKWKKSSIIMTPLATGINDTGSKFATDTGGNTSG
jgi:hypothetical protein